MRGKHCGKQESPLTENTSTTLLQPPACPTMKPAEPLTLKTGTLPDTTSGSKALLAVPGECSKTPITSAKGNLVTRAVRAPMPTVPGTKSVYRAVSSAVNNPEPTIQPLRHHGAEVVLHTKI